MSCRALWYKSSQALLRKMYNSANWWNGQIGKIEADAQLQSSVDSIAVTCVTQIGLSISNSAQQSLEGSSDQSPQSQTTTTTCVTQKNEIFSWKIHTLILKLEALRRDAKRGKHGKQRLCYPPQLNYANLARADSTICASAQLNTKD